MGKLSKLNQPLVIYYFYTYYRLYRLLGALEGTLYSTALKRKKKIGGYIFLLPKFLLKNPKYDDFSRYCELAESINVF